MHVDRIRRLFPENTDDLFRELLFNAAYEHSVISLQGKIDRFTDEAYPVDSETLRQDLSKIHELFDSEPIPFFDATWASSDLRLSSIADLLESFPHRIDNHAVIKSFISASCSALQRLLLRCQLEFVDKNFAGADAEKTYEEYASMLFSKLSLFNKHYPIASYLASQKCHRSLEHLREILERLDRDWDRLSQFGLEKDSTIVNIAFELGDTHNGKSVAAVFFDNGKRVFYKPRSLAVEEACAKFSQKLGVLLGFTSPFVGRVIDRVTYGWAEDVTHSVGSRFANPEAAAEFSLILKLLSFTDVHYENVRFNEHGIPLLVDAETALTAGLRSRDREDVRVHAALSETVTSTGFFPSPLIIPKKRGETFVDVGVLGQRNKQVVTDRQLVLKNAFTNKMRLVYEDVAKHLSTDVDSVGLPPLYVQRLTSRYKELSAVAIEAKDAIASLLSRCFSKSHLRMVVQDTIKYTNAIQLATNQECLRHTDLYIAALLRFAIGRFNEDSHLLSNELDALISGDIPRYLASSHSRNLYGLDCVVKQDYLVESPIENALRRLRNISTEAIDLDCWLIEVSFASYYDEASNRTHFKYPTSICRKSNSAIDTLNVAIRYLLNGYVPGSDGAPATWIGAKLSSQAHQYWYVDEVSMDLYAGSSGLALPLLLSPHVGLSGQGAREASEYYEGLLSKLESLNSRELSMLPKGALSGCESVLWPMHCCFSAQRDDHTTNRIKRLAESMISSATQSGLDFTSGTIGLSTLAKSLGVWDSLDIEARYLDAVESFGDQRPGEPKLSGYAHGHAGVLASAALLYGDISDTDRLVEAVDRQFAQFWSFRDGHSGLWPIDTRQNSVGKGWCSGTPGILLALTQLHTSDLGDRYELVEVIETLISVVEKDTFGGNPTLCHGDVGNLWILEHVAKLLGHEKLVKRTREAGSAWIERILPVYLRSLSRSSISHSLFAGIAGAILYGEHLICPEEIVRCPLWLE